MLQRPSKFPYSEIAAQYEGATGNKVTSIFDTAGATEQKFREDSQAAGFPAFNVPPKKTGITCSKTFVFERHVLSFSDLNYQRITVCRQARFLSGDAKECLRIPPQEFRGIAEDRVTIRPQRVIELEGAPMAVIRQIMTCHLRFSSDTIADSCFRMEPISSSPSRMQVLEKA